MGTRKKSRRARGTGTIFQRNGVWIGRKPIGQSPSGRTLYVERRAPTQAAVIRKLAEALPPGPDCTVAEWAARWRDTITVRAGTRHSYGVSVDQHILPTLGHLRMVEVSTSHVERLIATLLKTLQPGTVRKVVAHCRVMFAAAERAGVIARNPVALSRKPRHHAKPLAVYSPAQLALIIAASSEFAAGGVIALLAATGCRIGEALALDVGDWLRPERKIRIERTYSRRFGAGEPKSRHSRRTITVPDVVVPVLDAAAAGHKSGPLFRSNGGRRIAQDVSRAWESVVVAAGVHRLRLHDLRHSVATHLIANGVPMPDVARYLGDTPATVVKTYLHPSGSDPGATLNKFFGNS